MKLGSVTASGSSQGKTSSIKLSQANPHTTDVKSGAVGISMKRAASYEPFERAMSNLRAAGIAFVEWDDGDH